MVEKQRLLDKYFQIRTKTEELCKPLEIEDYVPQPIEDVSPPKWHLGHVSWFFEVFILIPYKKKYKPYNLDFHYLFNSYYESLGKRIIRANRGNLSRPSVEEIYKYRKYIDNEIGDFLNQSFEIDQDLKLLFDIGLNHEQQHQELLIYDIKYILGTNPLFPAYNKKPLQQYSNKLLVPAFIENTKESMVQIGNDGSIFCFDNEMPSHQIYLPPYKICNSLVTNEDYLEFIDAGGYTDFNNWLSDGWNWLNHNKIQAPLYWHKVDGEWYYYTLDGLQKLNLKEILSHISYYEADAFARWKEKRLPTEYEWEAIAKSMEPQIPQDVNLLDQKLFRPTANTTNSLHFWGDVWEWTQSAYLPYPGYKQAKGALGEYNGKFMVNQMVLKGGSYATPNDHIRISYRNFFQPDKRWMISGLRLADNL